MEEAEKELFAPILPFDSSMYDSFVIYDNQTYVCNRDICQGRIQMSTGNIVKYFSYQMDTEKTAVSIA